MSEFDQNYFVLIKARVERAKKFGESKPDYSQLTTAAMKLVEMVRDLQPEVLRLQAIIEEQERVITGLDAHNQLDAKDREAQRAKIKDLEGILSATEDLALVLSKQLTEKATRVDQLVTRVRELEYQLAQERESDRKASEYMAWFADDQSNPEVKAAFYEFMGLKGGGVHMHEMAPKRCESCAVTEHHLMNEVDELKRKLESYCLVLEKRLGGAGN